MMDDDEYISRSRKKRESTALQKYGEEIAALTPGARAKLPLTPELAGAMKALGGMKSREAKRRHLQYIGRLMRELSEEDGAALLTALEDMRREAGDAAGALRRIEALRDALLAPDEEARQTAMRDCLNDCPTLDRARLAHLVGSALADREKKRPPKHGRELFRYLRDTCAGKA